MANRAEIIQTLLEKMFEYAGYPAPNGNLRETKKDWHSNYYMRSTDKDMWVAWGTRYLQTELGLSKDRAGLEMDILSLSFGLKTY